MKVNGRLTYTVYIDKNTYGYLVKSKVDNKYILILESDIDEPTVSKHDREELIEMLGTVIEKKLDFLDKKY